MPIKQTIRRIRLYIHDMQYVYWMAKDLASHEGEEFNKVEWFCEYILQDLKYMWCEHVHGHDYEPTWSYATGDSGAEQFTCSKCGHNVFHRYY